MGWFETDSLMDRIPGYAGLAWDVPESCRLTVYLTDPAAQAKQARTVLAPAAERCPSDPHIQVEKSDFHWRELLRMQLRISTVLNEAGESHRGVGIQRGRLFVNTLNPSHTDRVSALLRAQEPALPLSHIDLNLRGPPYELDGPVHPPIEAYRAIIDSLPSGAAVDTTGLPQNIVAHLRTRDLRLTAGECGTRSLKFLPPRGFEDNRFQVAVVQQPPSGVALVHEQVYEVSCTDRACHVSHSMPGIGDLMVGCRAKRR